MPKSRHPDLQLAEDAHHMRLGWKMQRIGWAAIAALVVAGLAGLLGSGPLSFAMAASDDGALAVRYERFAHRGKPAELEITYGPAALEGDELRLWVDRTFLEQVKITQAVPEPKSARATPDRVTFVFDADRAGGFVTLHFEHEGAGRHAGRLGAAQATLAMRFVVYP